MNWKYGIGAALLAFVAGSTVAVPDDEPLSPAKRKAIVAAIAYATEVTSHGGITAEDVAKLDTLLAGVMPSDLKAARDLPAFESMAPKEKATFERGQKAVFVMRTFKPCVSQASRVAVDFTSDLPEDWASGLLSMSAEPAGEKLEIAINALSCMKQPEFRVGAGLLAKLDLVFGGNREACIQAAENVLVDIDPQVGAAFGAYNLYDFHDTKLVDRWVGRFADERPVRYGPPEFTAASGKTVGEALVMGFAQVFFQARKDWHSDPEMATTFLKVKSASELAAWWKSHRDTWTFGPPESMGWQRIFDGVTESAVGEVVKVKGSEGDVYMRVEEFVPMTRGGVPRIGGDITILEPALKDPKGELEPTLSAGGTYSGLGAVSICSGDGDHLECTLAPALSGKVRVRWGYWRKPPAPARLPK